MDSLNTQNLFRKLDNRPKGWWNQRFVEELFGSSLYRDEISSSFAEKTIADRDGKYLIKRAQIKEALRLINRTVVRQVSVFGGEGSQFGSTLGFSANDLMLQASLMEEYEKDYAATDSDNDAALNNWYVVCVIAEANAWLRGPLIPCKIPGLLSQKPTISFQKWRLHFLAGKENTPHVGSSSRPAQSPVTNMASSENRCEPWLAASAEGDLGSGRDVVRIWCIPICGRCLVSDVSPANQQHTYGVIQEDLLGATASLTCRGTTPHALASPLRKREFRIATCARRESRYDFVNKSLPKLQRFADGK
ncbi:hypothetical protein PAAG_05446 [Paracoccidioides lutzii Pb01]|uniref:Uncharacterized protein n=1 Tax=Paracoccidioides lutzii (strain ATCC MYA-826 / Pb01) TaxID=502779 RepID=C1H3V3_PARBA|nr:hypothetical protein PAAG_05446 [Paracoccidioides lutzii Pb01]EEH34397.2 hypothetical protein PAAG_05446 [Paracoccidioides lutzii Pb01]